MYLTHMCRIKYKCVTKATAKENDAGMARTSKRSDQTGKLKNWIQEFLFPVSDIV